MGTWVMMNKKIERVEERPVYQLFYRWALDVEVATRRFGQDFRWLRLQALRSSESVCANMTEGFYSQYSTEYLQCLFRCRREARETTTHLQYGIDSQQLNFEAGNRLLVKAEDGCEQLSKLISSIERKIQQRGKAKPAPYTISEPQGTYEVRETTEVIALINEVHNEEGH